MLRINKADPDFYSSNEEIEYVFLNTFIDKTGILATYTNHAKSAKELIKKLVKQILCQRIKKKNSYAVSKNMRFGKWKPV